MAVRPRQGERPFAAKEDSKDISMWFFHVRTPSGTILPLLISVSVKRSLRMMWESRPPGNGNIRDRGNLRYIFQRG